MAVFSGKYRLVAKEAVDCVFRRVTFRKCTSGLDDRLKAQITGRIMRRTPKLGALVYKRFEVLSWIFLIITVVSLVYSGIAIYNLATYGSCDPDSGYCILTGDSGELVSCESEPCLEGGCECAEEGCELPDFEACDGNCTCIEGVCE